MMRLFVLPVSMEDQMQVEGQVSVSVHYLAFCSIDSNSSIR